MLFCNPESQNDLVELFFSKSFSTLTTQALLPQKFVLINDQLTKSLDLRTYRDFVVTVFLIKFLMLSFITKNYQGSYPKDFSFYA
jgi:hypothetical protein